MANYTQIVNYSKEQTYIVIDSYIAKDRHNVDIEPYMNTLYENILIL